MASSKLRRAALQRVPETSYSTKLDLFACEFGTEDKLRKVVADLFRKMGHEGVRIPHGPNEKGKDIVFYCNGPLGEKRLFACVVKNSPITGQAEDLRAGAPTLVNRILQSVVNQVQQAFNEPLPSGKGIDQWVDTVYVISPYECSPTTIDSVKGTLQRSGQITFVCGQTLLELFAEHWREFLWFESTVLLSYLSALRKGLEEDYALANLILRKSYLANSPGSLSELYVEPTFLRELKTHRLIGQHGLNLDLLRHERFHREIEEHVKSCKRLTALLNTAPLWEPHVSIDQACGLAQDVLSIAGEMADLWEASRQRHIAKVMQEARQGGRRHSPLGFAASGMPDASLAPSRNDVQVALNPSAAFLSRAEEVQQRVARTIDDLCTAVTVASRFATEPHERCLAALAQPEYLTYCQVSDASKLVPYAFEVPTKCATIRFEEDLLDRFSGSVLITGPAGFGKTTFCRWHAIRDASRLVSKEACILPVYVPLHPLSQGKLGGFEDAFLRSEELRKLIQQQAAGQSPFESIRLYLDGLDEVTSTDRQREIAELAEALVRRLNFVQVVLTGRDHVSGPALRWLPRVRLCPLSDEQVRRLTAKWLEPDRVDGFFVRLGESGNLAELMRIPLLATLILAVFRKTGSVPPNKTNLYALFVELLCGGWDFYKNIQRRENRFSLQDKTVVLTRLAGMLQNQKSRDADDANFRAALKHTFPGFMPDWDQLLEEIIEDGLLVRVGTALTFCHLSFQEFLAARDLNDPMGNRPKQALGWYYNGQDWWREVLAFYVTLTDRPGDMDEWLIHRAITSSTTVVDLGERVHYLRKALSVAFPAYKRTPTVDELYEKLRRKARKSGGTADASQQLEQSPR